MVHAAENEQSEVATETQQEHESSLGSVNEDIQKEQLDVDNDSYAVNNSLEAVPAIVTTSPSMQVAEKSASIVTREDDFGAEENPFPSEVDEDRPPLHHTSGQIFDSERLALKNQWHVQVQRSQNPLPSPPPPALEILPSL